MKAIHEKEYQTIRANNLCKEKDRMTAEFEIEFNRVKVSFIVELFKTDKIKFKIEYSYYVTIL